MIAYRVGQKVKLTPSRREIYSGRIATIVEVRDSNGPRSVFLRVKLDKGEKALGFWAYEVEAVDA